MPVMNSIRFIKHVLADADTENIQKNVFLSLKKERAEPVCSFYPKSFYLF